MKIEDKNGAQKSEAAYPVYDFAEAIKVLEAVRDLGGGNAPVSRSLLAQHLKFAENGPSFFQRVAASKAFGMIDGRGAYSVTDLAKQYLYPTVENGEKGAAVGMLTFPKAFSILVQKFDGGKLPPIEMIGNIIHAEADIPISKKNILAGCFVRSAQAVGVIDSSGFLRCKAFVASGGRSTVGTGGSPGSVTPTPPPIKPPPTPAEFTDQEEHSCYLDKDKKKKVTLSCPLILTRSEYERICKWIDATWIIEDKQ